MQFLACSWNVCLFIVTNIGLCYIFLFFSVLKINGKKIIIWWNSNDESLIIYLTFKWNKNWICYFHVHVCTYYNNYFRMYVGQNPDKILDSNTTSRLSILSCSSSVAAIRSVVIPQAQIQSKLEILTSLRMSCGSIWHTFSAVWSW